MTAFALLFPFPNLNSSSRISWHFYQLSVCHRLITYALLTRPPLSYTYSIRRLPIYTFVRLACVRHAASVHPEPGSNSQLKFILQLFTDFCVVFPYLPYSGLSCLLSDFHCPFIAFSLLFHHIFVTSALTARLLYYFYLPLSILFLKFFKKFFYFLFSIAISRL